MADPIAPVADAVPAAAAKSIVKPGAESSPERLVDPAVSQAKFSREIRAYRAREAEYRARGWLLIRAEFPEVFVLMAAPHIQQTPIIYGLLLDFRDYDLIAPSLRFVNPFTGEPLSVKHVRPLFQRRIAAAVDVNGHQTPVPLDTSDQGGNGDAPARAASAPAPALARPEQPANLVQGHGDHPAFLCVAGTREYHAHPYHSNDPWLAHRGSGRGTLHYLLNIVWRHGIAPLAGYQINVSMALQLDQSRIP